MTASQPVSAATDRPCAVSCARTVGVAFGRSSGAVEEAELGLAGDGGAEAAAVQIGEHERAGAQRQIGLELVERAARVRDVAGDCRAATASGARARPRCGRDACSVSTRRPAGAPQRANSDEPPAASMRSAGVDAARARIDGAVGADGDAFARRGDAAQRDDRGRVLAVAGELERARQVAARTCCAPARPPGASARCARG